MSWHDYVHEEKRREQAAYKKHLRAWHDELTKRVEELPEEKRTDLRPEEIVDLSEEMW